MKRIMLFTLVALTAGAGAAGAQDTRVGLKAGMTDAGAASKNMELVSNTPRSAQFSPGAGAPIPQGMPPVIADILYANSDMAFRGNQLFMGNFRGFQVFDISDASAPKLISSVVCPGGQGDVSIYKNLLFMSVEMPNGRVDCSDVPLSMESAVSPNNFLGVRIFDISDIAHPKQVGAVQTCRGSHTHTLVTDPKDNENVYIYVSGTSHVRPAAELAGCSGLPPEQDPNTSYFRIEVIKVPVNAPQNARIVNSPRIFADSAGNVAGLWKGGAHGEGTQATSRTDQCHDITVYSAIGLAAGACSGNGLLLDVSDPANPKRVDQVMDPNFAYWHSATFNNDGTKVIYTDEWGGGMAPRCQASDRKEWGADAIFQLNNRKMNVAGYYKLPAAQSDKENCVAHNGTLVPVPGRDIMAQAWYQGGISVFDFTDPKNPVEIAYFDRGPYDASTLHLGGYWSTYWYNGRLYGSEIGRGLDILELKASDMLSQNELDAAKSVKVDVLNPQNQQRIVWPASFVVARAYVDQLRRGKSVSATALDAVSRELDAAEKLSGSAQKSALKKVTASVKQLRSGATGADAARVDMLGNTVKDLADR